jgi:hypothetical protein
MKTEKNRILFLRLPRPFYENLGIVQNLAMACFYLGHSLEQDEFSHQSRFLTPEEEEPSDLLEEMIAESRKHPAHWIGRFASVVGWGRTASRRVFVLLKPSDRYSRPWIAEAERLLEDHFY